MAIIVGDIHGDLEKAQAFLSYRPDAEHIALGDYLDSFHEPVERQLEALHLLMESSAVLLLGNHEVHYLDEPLFRFPGYSDENAELFRPILEGNLGRFKPAYVADGWLCSHAGVIEKIAADAAVELIAETINGRWWDYLKDRTGEFSYQSVFYYNFWVEKELMAKSIPQIFGHVELLSPVVEGGFVALDTTNFSNSCWLFDTEECCLVQLPLEPKTERLRFLRGGAWV